MKVIILVVVLAGAAVLWLYAQPHVGHRSLTGPESDAAASSAQYEHLTSHIAQLEAQLLAEVTARHDLELLLAEYEKQLAEEATIAQGADTDSSIDISQDDTDADARLMDDALLAELGISRSIIKQIQRRFEDSRVSMISLRDRAARQGWIDTNRYNDELIALFDPSGSIRDEFGDDVYDAYLYAVGKPNRVQIKNVYDDTEASYAGIQPGDVVLRYGPEPLFSMRDLRLATMSGTAGQPVLVELLRDGLLVYVTVPQGPIGVELEAVNLKP